MTLNELRDEAYRTATEHGFTDASVLEDAALIHSEVSELVEEFRKGALPHQIWYDARHPIDKPCGIPSEIADIIIRCCHFAGKYGIDLDKIVKEKMTYNESRPFLHGKVI